MGDPVCEAVLTHLRSEQRPLHRDHLISELMRLAKASPSEYPQTTKIIWGAALDQLVMDGLVSVAGERVAIIRQPPPKKEDSGLLF